MFFKTTNASSSSTLVPSQKKSFSNPETRHITITQCDASSKMSQTAQRHTFSFFSFHPQTFEEEDEEFFETPGVYSLYMSQDLEIKHRTPQPSICMLWNGNKVKTFDGVTYTHELFCSHVLLQDYRDGTFNVILRSCPYESIQPCPHALDIFMQAEQFSFENVNGQVKMFTTKKEFPIPVQISGLKVTRSGLDVRIVVDSIQLTITWDTKVM